MPGLWRYGENSYRPGRCSRGFPKGKGLSLEKDYQGVEEIAAGYVKRDINYFVFDLVDVAPEVMFILKILIKTIGLK